MWKYVSRRIRDTFERGVNHFDKRGTTGVVNTSGNLNDEKNKRANAPCCWFTSRGCWNTSHEGNNNTNNNKWNFEHLTNSWIGAITWSSMFVIGWYTSQIIHLKHKYHGKLHAKFPSKLCSISYPYLRSVNKESLYTNTVTNIEKVVGNFTPTVHLVGNESNVKKQKISAASSSTTNPDSSDDILGDVLNSIENKLGMAAIDNGQLQEGLNLLRSAANRNYGPALYNLGLCYEMGLGVTANEKMAMELYRSAAALEHPAALYNLGIYYGQGRGGLARDTVTATRLLRLAAVQGQQDAIDALKSLDIEIEPLPKSHKDTWSYQYDPQLGALDSIVPTPTSLFVENVNYIHIQKHEAAMC